MLMRAKEVIKLEELKVTPQDSCLGQVKLPITAEKNREGRTKMQKFQGFYTLGVSQICSDN